jgi:hypothetical protein
MKKSTQKTLMALGIIFIFAMSSIAFVFSGFGQQQSNNDLKPLDKYVVDEEIDPRLENAYIQGGFTFLKFYYNNTVDRNLVAFVEQAPDSFITPTGQIQLIVLKIQSPTTYARILNINGAVDLADLTTDKIFESLCANLISPPTECVISFINTTS